MLENLFNLIKDEGTEAVINNPTIPNELNNAVLVSATHSVADGLQGVLAGGGLQSLLSLFNGNNTDTNSLLNNPIVQSINSNFTNKLTNDHGIPGEQASGIAGNLIPKVISNLINKTNDPSNDSFDINSIIGSLTGGNTQSPAGQAGGFDFQSIVSKFTGGSLDANNDGQVGLDDIISKVTNGARQQQGQNGGGLMDMIQGFLK